MTESTVVSTSQGLKRVLSTESRRWSTNEISNSRMKVSPKFLLSLIAEDVVNANTETLHWGNVFILQYTITAFNLASAARQDVQPLSRGK